jgi:hypothetical protein
VVANMLIEKTALRLCRHQFAMNVVGRAKVLIEFSAAELQFQQKLGFIVSYRSQVDESTGSRCMADLIVTLICKGTIGQNIPSVLCLDS